MAQKKSSDTSFRDLVARLNAMTNMTPEQERAELMEAANTEPKVLDEKDVTLSDIARLAGIKEYVEPVKVSKKAQKMVESITAPQSSITKAIAESDADDSIATNIKKAVTEESKRLDKIAELETMKRGIYGIVVISGEGVKGYYEKNGYREVDTFMVKDFPTWKVLYYYLKENYLNIYTISAFIVMILAFVIMMIVK